MWTGLGLVGWFFTPSPSHAAVPGSMRLKLSVGTAETNCPKTDTIAHSVQKRLGYKAFGPDGHLIVRVRIDRTDGRYVATIEHMSAEGLSMGERRIESDSQECSDLFEAVALTLALAAGPRTERKWGPRPRLPAGPIRSPRADIWTPYFFQLDDVMETSSSPEVLWNTGVLVTAGRGPFPGLALMTGWRFQWGSHGCDIDIEFHLPLPIEEGGARIQAMHIALSPSYCLRGSIFGACVRSEVGLAAAEGLNLRGSDVQIAPSVAAGLGADWKLLRSDDLTLELRAAIMLPIVRLRMLAGAERLIELPAVQGSIGLSGGMRF